MKADRTEATQAILRLWLAFRDLSDTLPPDEWTEEDLDLWGRVSKHTAVQDALSKKPKSGG